MAAPVDPQFQYQSLTEPALVPPPAEPVTESRWHQPWSDPVRTTIVASVIASIASGLFAPVLEPNTQITQTFESRWHQPWSEPVRVKIDPRLAVALATSGPFAPVLEPNSQITQSFESRWHYPWSEPVRQKPGIGAYLQDVLAETAPQPVPNPGFGFDAVTPDSVPVYFPIRFQYQVTPSWFRPPVVSFAWYDWLSEPVRQKPGLGAYLQSATAGPVLNPSQINQTLEPRWHYPWSEPVRQKPGLLAALQPSFPAWGIVTPPVTTLGEDRWHQPWTEPVRVKPGLLTGLQQFLASPPRLLPASNVTGTLAATEQGDLFSALGTFFTQPMYVRVGIIEIRQRSGLTGIIEIKQVSANVSILAKNPGGT